MFVGLVNTEAVNRLQLTQQHDEKTGCCSGGDVRGPAGDHGVKKGGEDHLSRLLTRVMPMNQIRVNWRHFASRILGGCRNYSMNLVVSYR